VSRTIRDDARNPKVQKAIAKALNQDPATLWGRRLSVQARGPGPHPTAHEGATTGRRLGRWGLGSYGPNTSIFGNLRTLRARSRELVRNNPWARNGVQKLVAHLAGTGYTPIWETGNEKLDELLPQMWLRWTDEADADGNLDLYGLAWQAARCVVESGEVLARYRVRRLSDGLTVPLQLQLLEPDFLDDSVDRTVPNRVVHMGIEFDGRGRRTAYYLFRQHPGDVVAMSGTGGFETIPVPASEVEHVYVPERPGQIRGLPWMSSLILGMYDLDGLEDAILLRQKAGAMIAGFIYPDAQGQFPGFEVPQASAGLQTNLIWEPGSMQVLPPGMAKIEWSNPPDAGPYIAQYMKTQLRKHATGLGLTYEMYSGDYEGVTYSSLRSAILEFRRWAEAVQWHTFVFKFYRPVVTRWLETGVAAGTLPIADFAENRWKYIPTWRPPKWEWVDPLSEVEAHVKAMRALVESSSEVIAERGEDVKRIYRRIANDNALADQLGLISDADPRRTSSGGAAQTVPVAEMLARRDRLVKS
jgi:lambda family phage portal protein